MDVELQKDVHVLQAMAEVVRGKTLKILDSATQDELIWSPPGLSNHLLWHVGHCVWLQDLLCIEAVTGRSEVPDGWLETFSMRCRPIKQTHDWPSRRDVRARLAYQFSRIREVIGSLSVRDLQGPPRTRSLPDTEPLSYWITHGLHDEANHQGEMHLLLKMQRSGCREGPHKETCSGPAKTDWTTS